jgi:hypothetical protein
MPSTPDFKPNNVWADNTPEGAEEEVTVPSGQTCRARKLSIPGMIEMGLLAESDALTAQVTKYMKKVKVGSSSGGPPQYTDQLDEQGLMKDPKAVTTLITMMDRAIPFIVMSPIVKLHYSETKVGKTKVTKKLSDEDRAEIRAENPGKTVVFTDQLDFGDKMWLFDWAAGGLATMLNFRQ